MAALWNRAGHYIFALWFLLSSSFSSPNVNHRRLDVCHTSTHGVALVRISDAGLIRAARSSLKNTGRKRSPKNRHLGTIAQLSCKAGIDNRKKKLFKQQYLLHMSPQYG